MEAWLKDVSPTRRCANGKVPARLCQNFQASFFSNRQEPTPGTPSPNQPGKANVTLLYSALDNRAEQRSGVFKDTWNGSRILSLYEIMNRRQRESAVWFLAGAAIGSSHRSALCTPAAITRPRLGFYKAAETKTDRRKRKER